MAVQMASVFATSQGEASVAVWAGPPMQALQRLPTGHSVMQFEHIGASHSMHLRRESACSHLPAKFFLTASNSRCHHGWCLQRSSFTLVADRLDPALVWCGLVEAEARESSRRSFLPFSAHGPLCRGLSTLQQTCALVSSPCLCVAFRVHEEWSKL